MEGNNQKWLIVLAVIATVAVVISLLAISLIMYQNNVLRQEINRGRNEAQIANPASAYCEQMGGKSEIITASDGSQSGACKFDDGSQCEEWAFFRGECGIGAQGGNSDASMTNVGVAQNENKVELIKQAFSKKYNRNISEVTISISQETENYAKGGVKFGVGGVGEGGFFFAAKAGGVWEIVSDGNGEVNCSALKTYGFPANMALDCPNL